MILCGRGEKNSLVAHAQAKLPVFQKLSGETGLKSNFK